MIEIKDMKDCTYCGADVVASTMLVTEGGDICRGCHALNHSDRPEIPTAAWVALAAGVIPRVFDLSLNGADFTELMGPPVAVVAGILAVRAALALQGKRAPALAIGGLGLVLGVLGFLAWWVPAFT